MNIRSFTRTSEKAAELSMSDLLENDFGFLELRSGKVFPVILGKIYVDDNGMFQGVIAHDAMGAVYSLAASNHGREWRMWSKCPTVEQRRLTPWAEVSIQVWRIYESNMEYRDRVISRLEDLLNGEIPYLLCQTVRNGQIFAIKKRHLPKECTDGRASFYWIKHHL